MQQLQSLSLSEIARRKLIDECIYIFPSPDLSDHKFVLIGQSNHGRIKVTQQSSKSVFLNIFGGLNTGIEILCIILITSMTNKQAQAKFRLIELESRIKNKSYFSRDCLPNSIDAMIFQFIKLEEIVSMKTACPDLFHWYSTMKQFSQKERSSWPTGNRGIYLQDSFFCCLFDLIQRQGQNGHKFYKKEKISFAKSYKMDSLNTNNTFSKTEQQIQQMITNETHLNTTATPKSKSDKNICFPGRSWCSLQTNSKQTEEPSLTCYKGNKVEST